MIYRMIWEQENENIEYWDEILNNKESNKFN